MPAIVTDSFRVKVAQDFAKSLLDPDNPTYVAIGKNTPWANEYEPDIPDTDLHYSNGVVGELFAVKKVTRVSHVIPRINWMQNDDTYTQYDPTDPNLYARKFYTVAEDEGAYRVYKLIVRGLGPTLSKPVHTDRNPNCAGGSDGYVWKFMYEIPAEDFKFFGSELYVPVINIDDNASDPIDCGLKPEPLGGHGSNNILELGGMLIAAVGEFVFDEHGTIPVDTTFRSVVLANNLSDDAGEEFKESAGTFCQKAQVSQLTDVLYPGDVVSINGTDARVYQYKASDDLLFVKSLDGSVLSAGPIVRGDITGAVDSIEDADVKSGDLLYIENRKAISRNGDQVERVTVIVEF